MRAIVVALVFFLPMWAGCLGGSPAETGDGPAQVLGEIKVPRGAVLNQTAAEAVLEWADVEVPFTDEIVVPEGATLVRMTTTGPASASVRSYLVDAETARRRCNPDVLDAWDVGYSGSHTCSGIALIDPPGARWEVRASGPADTVADVRVEFSAAPLEGLAAQLDLTKLSMPGFELQETTGQYVPSFDGTDLWVEVTLPEGPGPWPTVIASSPYNGQTGRIDEEGGTPAMWSYFTYDWARRGYAVVNADVRGFGLSGGCVEVWGENEQRDQAFLVDWVAKQSWSDGHVGFYGQSYVGTTPVAAAVQAPEALDAIIAVAPVINAYEDWHYGGVPNGENSGSPVAYQVLTDAPGQGNTPVEIAQNAAKGLCDPTLIVRANDPRSIYDAYYEERNFKLRADQVKAAVLFTQGFEDSNVKSAMIPGWFNELPGPKLGLFGHWVHQHPTRADEEVLFLGWMDHYVKGRDLGFDALPPVEVVTNVETVRQAEAWPDASLPLMELWPDYATGELVTEENDPEAVDLLVLPGNGARQDTPAGRGMVTVAYDVEEEFAVSGIVTLTVKGTLRSQGNAYLSARLYDESPDGRALVSYGMFNLAHEKGHDRYEPVVFSRTDVDLPFLPTEWVFREGHRLVIEMWAVQAGTYGTTGAPAPPGVFTIAEQGEGAGSLWFYTPSLESYRTMPRSAAP